MTTVAELERRLRVLEERAARTYRPPAQDDSGPRRWPQCLGIHWVITAMVEQAVAGDRLIDALASLSEATNGCTQDTPTDVETAPSAGAIERAIPV